MFKIMGWWLTFLYVVLIGAQSLKVKGKQEYIVVFSLQILWVFLLNNTLGSD